jgi:hypothetical protein
VGDYRTVLNDSAMHYRPGILEGRACIFDEGRASGVLPVILRGHFSIRDVARVALIRAWFSSTAALLGAGLCNQPIDVRLFNAEGLRPLRAIVRKVRQERSSTYRFPASVSTSSTVRCSVCGRDTDFRQQRVGKRNVVILLV